MRWLLLLSSAFFMSCTQKKEVLLIKMGFTPAENAEVVSTNAKFITDVIEKKTGLPTKAYVATDYTVLVESMKGGGVQFAWLPSFAYVLAESRAGAKVMYKAVRYGKGYFYSAIIVRADSPYKKIGDLRGKNIAWVDPASASGHIVPKASLLSDGIDPDKFFKKQVFAGGHDSVLLGVLNGSVDAGAVFANDQKGESGAWNMLSNSRPEYKDKIRVIYSSKPIPNDTFSTTQKFYDEHRDIVEKIGDIIKNLDKSPEGKKALYDLYRIDSMTEAQSSEFEPLRGAAEKLKIEIEPRK